MDAIALLVQSMAAKFPVILAILAMMGVFRAILKPVFVCLKSITLAIPGEKDDIFLNKVESSSIYKGLVFALDYLFSIKLIK